MYLLPPEINPYSYSIWQIDPLFRLATGTLFDIQVHLLKGHIQLL